MYSFKDILYFSINYFYIVKYLKLLSREQAIFHNAFTLISYPSCLIYLIYFSNIESGSISSLRFKELSNV